MTEVNFYTISVPDPYFDYVIAFVWQTDLCSMVKSVRFFERPTDSGNIFIVCLTHILNMWKAFDHSKFLLSDAKFRKHSVKVVLLVQQQVQIIM